MTTITQRLQSNVIEAVYRIPKIAIGSFVGGYIYSTLADFPAGQAAKYWMINVVALNFIGKVSLSFTENVRINALIIATLTGVGAANFIYQMRKLELLGNKMMNVLIVVNTLFVLGNLAIASGVTMRIDDQLDKIFSKSSI